MFLPAMSGRESCQDIQILMDTCKWKLDSPRKFNPRTEDGDAIIDQIRSGFVHPEVATKIRNRAEAIAAVIDAAKPGAVILIAGKGHEDYQEINGQRQPFSDLEHARAALVKRRSSSNVRDSIQRDAT